MDDDDVVDDAVVDDAVVDDDIVDEAIVVDEVELPVVVDTGACVGVQLCDCDSGDGHAVPSEEG